MADGLSYGVVDEAFKYYTGVLFDSSKKQIKNFPKELWAKYPEHNIVPGGRDIFNSKNISLISGVNDWAAFQVAVKMDKSYILSLSKGLNLSPRQGVTNLRFDFWCECKDLSYKMQIEEMVEDSDRSLKADVLSDNEFKEYNSFDIAMIWVELKCSLGIKPSKYLGGINIYQSYGLGEEENVGQITFELNVMNVVLPDKSNSTFELDLWQHNCNIARMYQVIRYSNEHFEILENYIKSLADLGEKCISIVASDIPWCGQTCHRLNDGSNVYEYNIINIIKDKNGNFHYDYSNMQKYINLCFKYGISKWIKIFGLVCVWSDEEYGYGNITEDYPDAIKLRYLDESDGCMHTIKKANEIEAYIISLENYFIKNNLIDKVLLSADEPLDFDYYTNILNKIRTIAPKFRFFSAINHTSHIEATKDSIDSFCIILPSVAEEWEKLKQYKKDPNKIYTWYVCCGPAYPNMFLRSNLLETRLVGILTKFLGLDGFLRWNYTVWNNNPRSSLCWHLFPAGDNCFVYPGENGKPLLSLRYKQLKRAIEDYMYIDMIKNRIEDSDKVLKKIYKLIFKTLQPRELVSCNQSADEVFNLDFNDFNEMKTLILTTLEKNN